MRFRLRKRGRFSRFSIEEQAALHHALWSGWENATPIPGDVELVYPKDTNCICERLLGELDYEPHCPGDKNIPYQTENPSLELHSSRGNNPRNWAPPKCL